MKNRVDNKSGHIKKKKRWWKDILHSHVGDLNIWSNTDTFAFPVIITTSVYNYAPHAHFFSLFLCGIIWHLNYFFVVNVFMISSKSSRSCTHGAKCLPCVHFAQSTNRMGWCVKWKEGWDLFTIITAGYIQSVGFLSGCLFVVVAEQWYKCTITYLTVKMRWWCPPLKRFTGEQTELSNLLKLSWRTGGGYHHTTNTERLHEAESDWS